MIMIIWTVAVLQIIAGLLFLAKPDTMKKMYGFFTNVIAIYVAVFIKVALGIIFLILATKCRWPQFIIAIGILMAGGPLGFMAMGPKKIKAMMQWFQARSTITYRLIGLLSIVLGAILLYAAIPSA
jgi:uncharacterized protein YjeT (DUF2065 family)